MLAMKFIITTEEHTALSDDLKSQYKEQDGALVLNLEGHEEHFVPKAKKDLAEGHRREAEKNLAAAETREAELLVKLDGASGKKEIEEIRANAAADIEKIKGEFAERDAAVKAESNKNLIAVEAGKFAGDKFTVPSLIQDKYASRLQVEEIDGKQVIRVLEADGTASAKSIADLQKEILDNPEYATIIKGTQSSGGSADNNQNSGGSSAPKAVEFSNANIKGATAAVEQSLRDSGHSI
jgi:hypothetical protein